MSTSRIKQLATLILENTTTVDDYLAAKNLPQPSFDADGPVKLGLDDDPEIEAARIAALEASYELQDLLNGPADQLRPMMNATSLQAIYKFNIPAHVPLDGQISYTDLANACNVYEPDLRRILRFAMVYHRCFKEPRKGYVAHTAASKLAATDELTYNGLGLMYDDNYQSFAHTIEAMTRFKSQEPNETGHALARNTDLGLFAYLGQHPDEAQRFAKAMASFGTNTTFITTAFPWSALGKAKVVDLGGSKGHISIALAEAYPDLSFVVQDLPEVVASAAVPGGLEKRIEIMAHDAFVEQPVEADAYLIRFVFHDWPDKYVIQMLRALIPALKKGKRVLVNDYVLPEPGTLPYMKERVVRGMDMIMLSLFNGRERERGDWVKVFREADKRFVVKEFHCPEGSAQAVIEVVWEG